ncbi:hypothetical protein BDV59DRAFT_185730 [Aspergillus ambiguus]|uniref:uncharacterized protein n=1 Tax=Aspergillus ambiguus TaxID=176160 RepID=UPI003CCD7BBF
MNQCDITTSCIFLGGDYHCACRPGYKSGDPAAEYRIETPEHSYLVFVPENTPCNELCDYQLGNPAGLCADVPFADDTCTP